MKVETGYLYHIKDEYFDVVKDEGLMKNRERGKMRPTYFTIKDGDILWFIPLSTKVDKYKKIIKEKFENIINVIRLLLEQLQKVKQLS